VARFAEAVNRHPGVTHNYLRENAFNVWFTFIAPSMEEIEAKLSEISAETGVTDILNLPADARVQDQGAVRCLRWFKVLTGSTG